MTLTLAEAAKRIQEARFGCVGRPQPCGCCTSAVYQGCIYLASAVLEEPLKMNNFPDLNGAME